LPAIHEFEQSTSIVHRRIVKIGLPKLPAIWQFDMEVAQRLDLKHTLLPGEIQRMALGLRFAGHERVRFERRLLAALLLSRLQGQRFE
jgi:hypothetical protein